MIPRESCRIAPEAIASMLDPSAIRDSITHDSAKRLQTMSPLSQQIPLE
jgi:hypothetical protein